MAVGRWVAVGNLVVVGRQVAVGRNFNVTEVHVRFTTVSTIH